MVDFSTGLGAAIKSGFCSVIGTVAAADELAKNISPPEVGSLLLWNMPDAIYQLVCNQPPPAPPTPSFTGGQCDANYNVRVVNDFVYIPNGNVVDHSDQTIAVRGSIKGLQLTGTEGVSQVLNIIGGAAGSPGSVTYTFAASNNTPNIAIRNQSITSVTRIDGQPDNCGDGPANKPPYVPGTNVYNTNVTYDSGGTSITVPVGLAFGYANVDINGHLNIPVNVTVNASIPLTANFNLSTGGISFNFQSNDPTNYIFPDFRPGNKPYDTGNSTKNPAPPPGGGSPTPPTPTKPETSKVIIGVFVTVTSDTNKGIGTIFQSGNPNVRIPDLGLVSFNIPNSSGGGGWTNNIRVQTMQCYIPCPASQGAVAVKGTPREGVTWTLTPCYSKKESPVGFPT